MEDALYYKSQNIRSALATVGVLLDATDKREDEIIYHYGRLDYIADLSPSSDAEFYYLSDHTTIYNYKADNKSKHNFKIGYGIDISLTSGWSFVGSFERFKANGKGYSNDIYLSVGYVPTDLTKFSLNLNYNENLKTGINIARNINGYGLKFNIDTDLESNSQNSNIYINKLF